MKSDKDVTKIKRVTFFSETQCSSFYNNVNCSKVSSLHTLVAGRFLRTMGGGTLRPKSLEYSGADCPVLM